MILTQPEAAALLALEKHRLDDARHTYPHGDKLIVQLQSADKREQFHLDISRQRIDIAKGTYQNRARTVQVLARLDFGGAPHRNPDGEEVPSPHLHLYREGFGDKWAYPLPAEHFTSTTDKFTLLQDFMRYCTITKPPIIDRGLFT